MAPSASEGMGGFLDTVYRQMRMITQLSGLLYLLNSLCLFAIAVLGIWLWLGEAISIGAIAVALGLVLRLWGMSQWMMWEKDGGIGGCDKGERRD